MAADLPENHADDFPSDTELMALVGRGDQDAFRLLVERHQGKIVGTIARMLGGERLDEAEDLAQEVFVRAWKAAPRFRPEAKVTTWLYTIARNHTYKHLAKRWRRSLFSLEAYQENHPEIPGQKAQETSSQIAERELQATIDAAIQNLPKKQRLALILRRYEALPYEEIAQVLSTTVPAVKSLLFRAREQLRQELAQYLEND